MSGQISAIITTSNPYISSAYSSGIHACCVAASSSVSNPICSYQGEANLVCAVDTVSGYNQLKSCVQSVAESTQTYPSVVAIDANVACMNLHNQNPRSFSCANMDVCASYATARSLISFSIPSETLDISTALPFSTSVVSTTQPATATIAHGILNPDSTAQTTQATTQTTSDNAAGSTSVAPRSASTELPSTTAPVSSALLTSTFTPTSNSSQSETVTTTAVPASSPTASTVSTSFTSRTTSAASGQSSVETTRTSAASSSAHSYQKIKPGSKLIAYVYIWSITLAVLLAL